MELKIRKLIDECKNLINSSASINEIRDIRLKFLSKNGEFTALLKDLKNVPNDLKPAMGNLVNQGKIEIEGIINKAEKYFLDILKAEKLKSEYLDITTPARALPTGSLHPLTIVKNDILNILIGLGFTVKEGPEIETDYYNFQALNIPLDHPARDMQDTFYINDNILLRTHTSPMQARTMLSEKLPIKIIVPGKVYRSDDDATHSPMFQQIEGLYVDKHVTLSDLKATLEQFAKAFFNENTKTRLRPSFFPFTEPSVEIDVTCAICGGKGCKLCKGTGWIEILGGGIVNPQVLRNCNIDSNEYSGFAFGVGIERITMIKYGIPDMRILFENDVRFLKQYK